MTGFKPWIAAALAALVCACTPIDLPAPGPSRPGPGATGGICAGIAGFACKDPGDYCRMEAGQCRMTDAAGTCTPRRPACTRDYKPVCGCDGKTYANACSAAAAGASVEAPGECPG